MIENILVSSKIKQYFVHNGAVSMKYDIACELGLSDQM